MNFFVITNPIAAIAKVAISLTDGTAEVTQIVLIVVTSV